MLSKDHLLRAVVDKINHKLATRILPLQSELSQVRTQLEQAVTKKRRYLDLFEQGSADQHLFTGRMQEIQNELNRLHAEKSRLECEIGEGTTSHVSFEQVRDLIERFDQILTAAPFAQRKTLLHLFVKRITVNSKKQIETIELSFDENVDSFFSSSPVAAAGDSFQRKQAQKREKIEITI